MNAYGILEGEFNLVCRIRKCLTDKMISKLGFGGWVKVSQTKFENVLRVFGTIAMNGEA